MTQSRTERMVSRLRDLQAGTPDIEGSAVVSVDGLMMASALPSDLEEDRVSAMSAAMLSLGERIAGELEAVAVEGDVAVEATVAHRPVGERAVRDLPPDENQGAAVARVARDLAIDLVDDIAIALQHLQEGLAGEQQHAGHAAGGVIALARG